MTAWTVLWAWRAGSKSFIARPVAAMSSWLTWPQLAAKSKPSIAFLEYLAELYNSANREIDYAQVLSRLFGLYFEAGNFAKAVDALDRAVDIDPYEAEHEERMKNAGRPRSGGPLASGRQATWSRSARAGYGYTRRRRRRS